MNNDTPELKLPKSYPGQMEFRFPKIFKPKEMGAVAPPEIGKFISLDSSFISNELIKGVSPGKNTDVCCPFCKKGYLRLIKVEPIYSSGSDPYGPKYYVGDSYKYDCSAGCGARFSGKVQWMLFE